MRGSASPPNRSGLKWPRCLRARCSVAAPFALEAAAEAGGARQQPEPSLRPRRLKLLLRLHRGRSLLASSFLRVIAPVTPSVTGILEMRAER